MAETKTHSWPENHWHWPVELSHYHGVRRGGLIFTGGQADLDKHGSVVNPHDLTNQTLNVLQHVEAILTDLQASLSDLVKLVVYFTGDASDEALILELIASQLKKLTRETHPVVSTICLPALCYPDMRIELEGIAIDPLKRTFDNPQFKRAAELPQLHEQYSHAVRCNNLIFTSDLSSIQADGKVRAEGNLEEQSRIMMEQLQQALSLFGASTEDVLKLNVFYLGDGTADNWEKPAAIRAGFFEDPGPAATGITVNSFARPGVMTKITATAAIPDKQTGDSTDDTRYSWPEGHWNWTSPLPYKHGASPGRHCQTNQNSAEQYKYRSARPWCHNGRHCQSHHFLSRQRQCRVTARKPDCQICGFHQTGSGHIGNSSATSRL